MWRQIRKAKIFTKICQNLWHKCGNSYAYHVEVIFLLICIYLLVLCQNLTLIGRSCQKLKLKVQEKWAFKNLNFFNFKYSYLTKFWANFLDLGCFKKLSVYIFSLYIRSLDIKTISLRRKSISKNIFDHVIK